MAALGGVLWAVYSVGLGLAIAWIAGPGLQSLVGSVVTVGAVGLFLSWLARRWQRTHPVRRRLTCPSRWRRRSRRSPARFCPARRECFPFQKGT